MTLFETHREDGKVEQCIIANLYRQNSVAEALQELERQIAEHEQWLQRSEASHREPWGTIGVDGRRVPEQPRYYQQDEDGREIPYYSSPTMGEMRERKQREQMIQRLQKKHDRLLKATSSLRHPDIPLPASVRCWSAWRPYT